MSDMPDKPKRGGDWLSDRQNQLIGGIALILLGVIFFLQEAGLRILSGNWWAVFILIPGVVLLWRAYMAYHAAGNWTRVAREQIVAGVGLIVIAGIFIFNLDWGKIWPVFLILAGLGALFGTRD